MGKRRKVVVSRKKPPLTAAEKAQRKKEREDAKAAAQGNKAIDDAEALIAKEATKGTKDSIFAAAYVSLAKRKREFELRLADVERLDVQCVQLQRVIDETNQAWQASQRRVAQNKLNVLLKEKTALKSGDMLKKIEEERAQLKRVEGEQNKRVVKRRSALSAGFTDGGGNNWTEKGNLTFSHIQVAMVTSGAMVLMHSTKFCPHCPTVRLKQTVDGNMVCPSCKQQVTAVMTAEATDSNGNGQSGRTASCYRPQEHTMNRLKSMSGQRRCRLSQQMWRKIVKLVWQLRIRKEEANSWVMRAIMSELGITHKYDFGNWLLTRVWGISPPQFSDVTTQEIRLMVASVQGLWKDYTTIYDVERSRQATVSKRRKPRNHVNHSNSAYLLRTLLRMRGYDVDPWANAIIDPRNMSSKDVVMEMVAAHLGWDMKDILFKGPQPLRDLNKKAQGIMRRPRPPPTVDGVLVTEHWAASGQFTPWLLVVRLFKKGLALVAGPVDDEYKRVLEGGMRLDPATNYMWLEITADDDFEVPVAYVDEWDAHGVDPESPLYGRVVLPFQKRLDDYVTLQLAKEAAKEARKLLCVSASNAGAAAKLLMPFGDDECSTKALRLLASAKMDEAVKVLCDGGIKVRVV